MGWKLEWETAKKTAIETELLDNAAVLTSTKQIAFKSLMGGLEAKRYVISNFQRTYQWSEELVENLVVSLVCRMPIPPVYGYRNENGKIVRLDGQQKLISLYLNKKINRKSMSPFFFTSANKPSFNYNFLL